jgi:signal peptidase II
MRNKKTGKRWLLFIDLILFIFLVFIDQMTKSFAVLHLCGKDSFPLISGVLELHYLENFGAAFGLLQNQKIFFILIAILICIMIAYVLYRIPPERKYIPFNFLLVLIASGAAGNMVDRTMHAYVIDFIYFSLIDFPVFNVADIYVTVSTILLVLFILFYYKEQDFSFLSIKQQKKTRKIS